MSKKRTTLATVADIEIEYLPSASKRERKSVVVDRALEDIYARHGVVSVDTVLVEAASDKHPLHSYFEWDDKKAGEKYRKVQAYSLIMGSKFVVQLVQDGSIDVRVVKESVPVRRLVSAFRGEGFKMRTEALADDEMRKAIIESKKSALRSWCKGVVDIPELNELRSIVLAHL